MDAVKSKMLKMSTDIHMDIIRGRFEKYIWYHFGVEGTSILFKFRD